MKMESLLCFTASVLTCAALPFANVSASAQAEKDRLVSPISYEQYLPLNEPSDVAVCEDYTAIADGNSIYVYERADNEYRTVSFPASLITKIQFTRRISCAVYSGNVVSSEASRSVFFKSIP